MDREWLREQIAFAIWNDTNPQHMRENVTLKNIGLDPEITTALGDGWKAVQNLGLDWRLNRDSFLKLADVGIRAFEAADADGSAYAPAEQVTVGGLVEAFRNLDNLIAAIGNGHSSRIAAELAEIRDTFKRANASPDSVSAALRDAARAEAIEECAKIADDMHKSALERLEKSVISDAKLINDARQAMAAYIASAIRSRLPPSDREDMKS